MLTADPRNVRYLGYVPEGDLPGLVSGAVALVYPSFYEGFGLPAAQAMAAGVPVVGSDRSCLPEVIGDGGILVNPSSVEELSAAFHRLCTSPDLAAELGVRGRARAQRFRWSLCAAESLEFFRDVSSRPA
jgi:alpha-1,3-rhamnosyl/mannosyltransferase